MTADYQPVQKALESGADPAMLCTTCPWDRPCITPPKMTSAEIEAQINDASTRDEEEARRLTAAGKTPGLPGQTLMTALIYAGKDTSASVCPVFALRLRSSAGRKIADSLRASMQGWDDES